MASLLEGVRKEDSTQEDFNIPSCTMPSTGKLAIEHGEGDAGSEHWTNWSAEIAC